MRLFLLFVLLLPVVAIQAQTRQEVDTRESNIVWHGTKVTGSHHGDLKLSSGEISVLGGKLVEAVMVVDMTSITCTDITNEGPNQKLVDHLRSEDFFHTQEHPQAHFRSTTIVRSPASEATAANYSVTGDLVVKGISHPVTFDCAFTREGEGYRATGTLIFDRRDHEIRYRSGSFFEDLGDKLIHDEVRLDLDIRTR